MRARLDTVDPLEEWGKHLRSLDARRDHLTAEKFSALRYEAPGTDLVLGLPDDLRWEGGTVATPEGRSFAPNIPTEEVFTSPHRLKAEGRVAATKPLSLFGKAWFGATPSSTRTMAVTTSAPPTWTSWWDQPSSMSTA